MTAHTARRTPVHRGPAAWSAILPGQPAPEVLNQDMTADFALIGAWQADYIGNLNYLLTAHNFNPVIAMAGAMVIAEPEAILPVGLIPPDAVKTPGVLVDHLVIPK